MQYCNFKFLKDPYWEVRIIFPTIIAASLALLCLYFEKCFPCCCSCWKGTGSYVGVFDICNPDKEFKLHNGEVVPVDDDEPEINNKMFDQDVEAQKNDNGLALDENEIEMRERIEDLTIENVNLVGDEVEMNNKNFNQEVEALRNDDGSIADEDEIDMKELLEELVIEILNTYERDENV